MQTSNNQAYATEQKASPQPRQDITIDDGDPYFLPPLEVTLLLMRHQLVMHNMEDAA